jgi:hypothetical protein
MDKKYFNMEKNKFAFRLLQIFEIDLKLPLKDKGIFNFYIFLKKSGIENTISEDDYCKKIMSLHSNDVVNILMECFNYCKEKKIKTSGLECIFSIFNVFRNLRNVTFTFINDENYFELFENALSDLDNEKKQDFFNQTYTVTKIEMYLSDSLDKNVVDFFNNMFIFYGYIPNDYMNRKFYVDFDFDDYVSFMNMVLSNNSDFIQVIGEDGIDFLTSFPTIVTQHKPKVRLITNYIDL